MVRENGDDSGDATGKHLRSGSVVRMHRPLPDPPAARFLRLPLATLSGVLLAALMTGACGSDNTDSAPDSVATTESSQDFDDNNPGSTATAADSSDTESLDPSDSMVPSSFPSVVATRFATLGGWDGTEWTTYGQPNEFAGPASIGDAFSIVLLNGSEKDTTVESVGPVCGPDSIGILTNPEIPSERGRSNPIAVRADWELQPHRPVISGTATPIYFDAVREFFSDRQVEVGPIEITQWFNLDLEGDGVDEVVLSAKSQGLKPGEAPPMYPAVSVVLLRRVVDEQPRTYFLSHTILTEADGASLIEGEIPDIQLFNVAAFADLNGDARVEIIVNNQGSEGSGTTVWEFINNQIGARAVLSGSCES